MWRDMVIEVNSHWYMTWRHKQAVTRNSTTSTTCESDLKILQTYLWRMLVSLPSAPQHAFQRTAAAPFLKEVLIPGTAERSAPYPRPDVRAGLSSVGQPMPQDTDASQAFEGAKGINQHDNGWPPPLALVGITRRRP